MGKRLSAVGLGGCGVVGGNNLSDSCSHEGGAAAARGARAPRLPVAVTCLPGGAGQRPSGGTGQPRPEDRQGQWVGFGGRPSSPSGVQAGEGDSRPPGCPVDARAPREAGSPRRPRLWPSNRVGLRVGVPLAPSLPRGGRCPPTSGPEGPARCPGAKSAGSRLSCGFPGRGRKRLWPRVRCQEL